MVEEILLLIICFLKKILVIIRFFKLNNKSRNWKIGYSVYINYNNYTKKINSKSILNTILLNFIRMTWNFK